MSEAGYSGTPLPRKLGIKPGARMLLAGASDGFTLAPLPPGAVLHHRAGAAPYDLILVFCRDATTLHRRFAPLAGRLTPAGALWVAWPKRASGVATDLNENRIREHGLAVGLVDVKVIAIDDVWSGLKFVVRLRDRL